MDRSLAELRERLRNAPDTELPPSIARLVAEHGNAAGTGARQPVAEPAGQPPPAAGRPLSDSEVLELESVQRRQLLDALLHGSSRANLARTGRGLWVGVAVALAIALVVALVAMVQMVMTQNASHKPASVVVTVQAPH